MSRIYPDRPVVGVGAVVWHGEQVLLVRRARPPRQGGWSLPGGGQMLGETVAEAALREVREETGLAVAITEVIATVDMIERDEDGRVRWHYTLIDVSAEAPHAHAVAGDDAAEVAWFALDALDGLGLWSETIRIIRLAATRREAARASR